jgi:hypothetical protein
VRAVVGHLRQVDQAGQLADLFLAAPDYRAVRLEEGWVLGAPSVSSGPAGAPSMSSSMPAFRAGRQPPTWWTIQTFGSQ